MTQHVCTCDYCGQPFMSIFPDKRNCGKHGSSAQKKEERRKEDERVKKATRKRTEQKKGGKK